MDVLSASGKTHLEVPDGLHGSSVDLKLVFAKPPSE